MVGILGPIDSKFSVFFGPKTQRPGDSTMAALAAMAALDLGGGAMVPAGTVPVVGRPGCRRFQAVLIGRTKFVQNGRSSGQLVELLLRPRVPVEKRLEWGFDARVPYSYIIYLNFTHGSFFGPSATHQDVAFVAGWEDLCHRKCACPIWLERAHEDRGQERSNR